MPTLNKEIPLLHSSIQENETLFLNKIWACIKQHSSAPDFGVQQLSDCMKLSRVQLNRKLQLLTGYAPARLIMHYRMQMAQELLVQEQASVKEIAGKCGFCKQGNFSRSFQQLFQCSPSQYRHIHKTSKGPISFRWQVPLGEESFTHLLHLASSKSWLSKLLKTIIDNIDNEDLTVAHLTAATYMSPSNLNRKIKQLFQVSPQHFIKDIRLQYAIELLSADYLSITDVAYKAGFFDPAHFSHCFKTAFGCKPTAYEHTSKQTSISWLKNKLDESK